MRRNKFYFGPLSNDFKFYQKLNNKIECTINHKYIYRISVVDDDYQQTQEDEFWKVVGTENWIESLITFILTYNQDSRYTGSDHCKLYLSTYAWSKYVLLQKQMAIHIKSESQRPTISLDVRTRPNPTNNEYAFGIIGGVGQLADADILRRIVKIIDQDEELSMTTKLEIANNMILKIHSSPPPRPNEFHVGNLYEASQHVIHYTRYMEDFLSDVEIEQYMLASNTAHTNLGILKFVSKQYNANGFSRSFLNIIENTVYVVKQTLKYYKHLDDVNHRVLVIGTTAAHKHRIYPNALEEIGMNVLMVEDEEQMVIQKGIDHIKKGELEIGGEVIVNAVRDKIKNATHVIMGCSEISLAVKREDIHKIQPDALFVDTTEFMAQSVAAWLIMQNKRYKWIKKHYIS